MCRQCSCAQCSWQWWPGEGYQCHNLATIAESCVTTTSLEAWCLQRRSMTTTMRTRCPGPNPGASPALRTHPETGPGHHAEAGQGEASSTAAGPQVGVRHLVPDNLPSHYYIPSLVCPCSPPRGPASWGCPTPRRREKSSRSLDPLRSISSLPLRSMLELCRLRWMKTFHYFHHSINPRNLMTTGDKIFTWYVTSIIDIMCIFIFMIKSDKLWKVVFLEWRVQVQGLTVVQGQNSWTFTICWIFFTKSSSLHLPAFIWGMETKNWCFLSKLVKNSVFCSIVIPAGRTKGSLLFLQQVF